MSMSRTEMFYHARKALAVCKMILSDHQTQSADDRALRKVLFGAMNVARSNMKKAKTGKGWSYACE